jgi:putative tricarboxylic transport membrane protein
VESGDLRVLGVSGEERMPHEPFDDVPTLTEQDVDLVFQNWRGVLAPPDISAERTAEFIDYFEQMHATDDWAEQIEHNGWTDDFLTGEDFEKFLEEQDARVSGTLEELGLL